MHEQPIAQKIAAWTSILLAAAMALVALFDFFGLLGLGFDDKIPELVLFLVSGMVIQHAVETGALLRKMDTGIADLQRAHFQALRDRLDPEMSKVYGELVDNLITNVSSAIRNRSIEITDLDLFRYYYRKTLEAYPRCTFLATSIPSESYFWKNDPTEQAIGMFIKKKGQMRRIFFTRSDPATLTDTEREVIETHVRLGVEVFVVHSRAIPRELNVLFFTESRGRLAWEAGIGGNEEMLRIRASSDAGHNQRYLTVFEGLLRLPALHRAQLVTGASEPLTFARVHPGFGRPG